MVLVIIRTPILAKDVVEVKRGYLFGLHIWGQIIRDMASISASKQKTQRLHTRMNARTTKPRVQAQQKIGSMFCFRIQPYRCIVVQVDGCALPYTCAIFLPITTRQPNTL